MPGLRFERLYFTKQGDFVVTLCKFVIVAGALAIAAAPLRDRAALAAAPVGDVRRSIAQYKVPDVVLIDQNDRKVHLRSLLNTRKPVMVQFVYATCTTICPVLSASFVSVQRKLGTKSSKVQMVSITIDPENDSPKVMKAYLKKYHGKPGWDFLTGSRADIDATMHAFDAYVPNKMLHYPLTLIRNPSTGSWIRLNGLMGSTDLMAELEKVMPK